MSRLVLVLAVLALGPVASAHAWVRGVNLTTAAKADPQLATGPDGEIAAVWSEPARIAAAIVRPGDAGFGTPFTVARTSGETEPRAAIGADGQLVVAWIEAQSLGSNPSADGVVRAVTGRPGGVFGTPQTVDTAQRHRGIGLAVGADGTAYLAYGRRAPDANRIDLFVTTRGPGAGPFVAETLAIPQILSGPGRARIPVVPQRDGAAVVAPAPLLVVADVTRAGAVSGTTTLGSTTWPVPSAVALGDGTLVVADSEAGVSPIGLVPRLRLRPPGGTFGAPEPLPGFRELTMAAAGSRLVFTMLATSDIGDSRRIAGEGLPGAFTLTSTYGAHAVAGAADGRGIAFNGTSILSTPFDRPSPPTSLATQGTPAAALTARLGVVLARGQSTIASALDGGAVKEVDAPPMPIGGYPSPGSPGCGLAARGRTQTLRRGGVAIRFRDFGTALVPRARPTLKVAALRGRRAIRHVELAYGFHRVRDRRAPFRLRLPGAASRRPGHKFVRVRLTLRDGRTRSTSLSFSVARCVG